MGTTSSRYDPLPPDKSSRATQGERGAGNPGSNAETAAEPLDHNGLPVDMLALIGRAETISKDYQMKTIERPLGRAYRAWQNQHAEGSKYLGASYKGRSRLFVPKTRSAVRKNLATAAAALFATEQVVTVKAAFDDDEEQLATAAVTQAVMDYRMNQATGQKSGIPWFMICMGGCLDSQLTGITISKQYWEFEEVETKETEEVMEPLMDEDSGAPVVYQDTGEPVMSPVKRKKMRIVKDRPMVELFPIENALVDPAAPWYAPAQLGRWFSMKYPMGLSDARAMLKNKGKAGEDMGWLDVSDELLLKGRIEDDRAGIRRVREGGSDRYEDGKGLNELDIVWLQENFLRISGVDYHFWSVGRFGYVSKIREVREAYPEYDGERPYTMGVAQIDSHRVFPMSPVDSWQPLQLELNDITNLRQDTLKRSIAPLTVVKRGGNTDLEAVRRRGQPDAVVLTNDIEKDLKFEATPGPTGASYTETSVNNAMFDELAGVFSTSSVQSNRQLNETVGGMRMMSGAANSVSEFDLRTWVETWVEPSLRQCMHLVRHHESDQTIMAIAGAKARVWEKYKYLPNLSDFEATEMLLRVNAGIGAADPMQQLGKLKMAFEMLAPIMEMLKAQGIELDGEALIEEIMGKAGYRDGRRFFKFGEPQPQQNPELEMFKAEMEFKNKELEQAFKELMLELKGSLQENAANNLTKLEIARQNTMQNLVGQLVDVQHQRDGREHDVNREDTNFQRERQGKQEEQQREDQKGGEEADRAERQGKDERKARIAEILAKNLSAPGKPTREGERPAPKPNVPALRNELTGLFGDDDEGEQSPPKAGGGPPPASGEKKQGQAEGPFRENMRDAVMGQTVQALSGIMDRLERLAQVEPQIRQISEHLQSPSEIIHDAQGRPVGVRKGARTQPIMRDRGGNIAGTGPGETG